MKYRDNSQFVIGICTRTTFKEQGYIEDLKHLWMRFFASNLEKIPHRLGNHIIAIYTDYENEDQGEYTAIVGVPVSRIETISLNCLAVEIPAGYYQTFTTMGIDEEAVKAAWQRVWAQPKSKLDRNFLVDFDVYDEKQVTLYVGAHN
jgi:predicted transcriptional regulator YdeE